MALSDYNNSTTYNFTNAKSITSGDWSIPTIATWRIFAGQLKITTSNYSGYKLKDIYWSSSGTEYPSGWSIRFSNGDTTNNSGYYVSNEYPVRLTRTF